MDELLQPLFGDEALTYSQFRERLGEITLADISQGQYVERAAFDELNTRYTEAQRTFFDAQLDRELEKAGARSSRAVKALLDREPLTLADGCISGLAEQLSRIKKENSFLFAEEIPVPPFGRPTPGIPVKAAGGGNKANAALRAMFGRKSD